MKVLLVFLLVAPALADRPNFVLCMADDQGWGDVAYNGHPVLKTPVLDEMAAKGLRFDRFYAAAGYCSPTRCSFLTGRHPSRMGCFGPNMSMRPEEFTLAEAAQKAGYATGHFGKWHVGPVKGGNPLAPRAQGFDQNLSHDNFFEIDPPLSRNGEEPEKHAGESSEVVVAAALQFIADAQAKQKNFLSVIWFGSPHVPCRGTPEDLALYPGASEKEKHYFAEITAMDRAMGKLRAQLRAMKLADNTLLFFCSDNGPIAPGSTGGLSGKKGGISEGGVRVPAVLEWPARIKTPRTTRIPCVTSDLHPTLLELIGAKTGMRPLDGLSLVPLLDNAWDQRPAPIAFGSGEAKSTKESYIPNEHRKGWWRTFSNRVHTDPVTRFNGGRGALIDNQYKLLNGRLYDLNADPKEQHNLAGEQPERLERMRELLAKWQVSVSRSVCGLDY